MPEHVTVILQVHDSLDPRCTYFGGTRAPWGTRWFFTCSECRTAPTPVPTTNEGETP